MGHPIAKLILAGLLVGREIHHLTAAAFQEEGEFVAGESALGNFAQGQQGHGLPMRLDARLSTSAQCAAPGRSQAHQVVRIWYKAGAIDSIDRVHGCPQLGGLPVTGPAAKSDPYRFSFKLKQG